MKYLNKNRIILGCIILTLSSCECEPCVCSDEFPSILLDLPETKVNNDPENTIDVYISSENTYLLFQQHVEKDSLANSIARMKEENLSETIQLFADDSSSWEAVVFVIDITKQSQMKLLLKTK